MGEFETKTSLARTAPYIFLLEKAGRQRSERIKGAGSVETADKEDPVRPDVYEIAVVPGDGIGPEVSNATVSVLSSALDDSVGVKFTDHEAGAECYLKTGTAFPEATLQACKAADAILRGDTATDTLVLTRYGIERIVRMAARIALKGDGAPEDGVKRVSIVDKANVLRSYAFSRGRNGRIALTYVEWAGNHLAETIVDWTVIDGVESAAGFANQLLQAPVRVEMWTSISTAIDYGSAMLEFSPHTGGRQVIDISGDGANNSGGYVVTARDAAVARGITINGLPIVNDKPSRFGRRQIPNLDLYYQDCVIGGDGAFLIVANGFGDFARVHLAAAQSRPGCDTGERRLDDFDDF